MVEGRAERQNFLIQTPVFPGVIAEAIFRRHTDGIHRASLHTKAAERAVKNIYSKEGGRPLFLEVARIFSVPGFNVDAASGAVGFTKSATGTAQFSIFFDRKVGKSAEDVGTSFSREFGGFTVSEIFQDIYHHYFGAQISRSEKIVLVVECFLRIIAPILPEQYSWNSGT